MCKCNWLSIGPFYPLCDRSRSLSTACIANSESPTNKRSSSVAYATEKGQMTRGEGTGGDLRVQRTHHLIMEALVELTAQKGFAGVTVRDIVRQAGIHRATLYQHYRDKFDLLDPYVVGLTRLFEHVGTHAAFFRVMLGTWRPGLCG